jgi:hypothetical protein
MLQGGGSRVEHEGFRHRNDTHTTVERGALFLAIGKTQLWQKRRHIKAERGHRSTNRREYHRDDPPVVLSGAHATIERALSFIDLQELGHRMHIA